MARNKARSNGATKQKEKRAKKRDQAKNKGLEKRFFSKIKQEYHDVDYAHLLSEEEKNWLSRFYEEDLGANFNHKDGGENIYKEVEDKRKSFGRNNARNRDIYGNSKAAGLLTDIDPMVALELRQQEQGGGLSAEDQMIESIDEKYSKKDT